MNSYCNLLRGAVVFVVSAIGLSGCAGQPTVKGSWQDDAPRDQTFSKLLVIGLTPDINLRCDFESFLVTQLRAVSASSTAISSCTVMSLKDPLSQETVLRAVTESGADAVLTTSLVAATLGAEDGGSSDTRGAGYYKATDIGYKSIYYGGFGYYGGYGAYGVPVVYAEFQTAPSITTAQGDISIASRLFATQNAALVYEVLTSARNLQSRESALAALSHPIAVQLQRAGLLR